MKKTLLLFFISATFVLPTTANASSIKGTSLGEISGCDYYLIEDNYGDYTLAEWYGGITPYSGDSVIGELHSYGFKDLYDISMDRSSRAWIDDYMLSEDSAMEQLVDKCGWSSDLEDYLNGGASYYYTPSYPSYSPPAPTPSIPSCPVNSYLGSNGICQCNSGYLANSLKNGCVVYTIEQQCVDAFGIYSIPSGTQCTCLQGYRWNETQTSCVPIVTPPPVSDLKPASTVEAPKTTSAWTPTSEVNNKQKTVSDFEVSNADILSIDVTGTIVSPATFRKCPSTQCTIIRYYAETSKVNIIGKYKKGDWYEISGTTDAGGTGQPAIGWIHSSLIENVNLGSAENAEQNTIDIASNTPENNQDKKDGVLNHLWKIFLSWF